MDKHGLQRAIDELENGLWDEEDVHNVDVRLDLVESALLDYLKARGEKVPKETGSLDQLLVIVEIGDEAVTAVQALRDYASSISYGLSFLTSNDVEDANEQLAVLHEALKKWFEELEKPS